MVASCDSDEKYEAQHVTALTRPDRPWFELFGNTIIQQNIQPPVFGNNGLL